MENMSFIFPNEFHITWTVMIVLYPFITGMVDGAFIVSSFYYVFGMEKLKSISKYALASAFVFLLFATMPLLNHLGRPDRALNIMITPNFSSAMSGFGFIYLLYLIIAALQIWFAYRDDIICKYHQAKGLPRKIYNLVLLGQTHSSTETKRLDKKMVVILGGIGIPVVFVLHGYVGFLFGSIKANLWWSTPLMFIIFISSAIVSGLAVLIFLYLFIHWKNKYVINQEAIDLLAKWLWGFMIFAVTLELMEILSIAYEKTEKWVVLQQLIEGKLLISYIYLQIGLFAIVPFLLLSITTFAKKLSNSKRNFIIWLASGMLILQVLLMRWNIVIGGQLVSKSMRGFTEYLPGIWDKEGLIVSGIILIAPFILLRYFDKIFPFFTKRYDAACKEVQGQENK